MGYEKVFTHVGDGVRIQAPNGKLVAPIVTGMPSLLRAREQAVNNSTRHFWFH